MPMTRPLGGDAGAANGGRKGAAFAPPHATAFVVDPPPLLVKEGGIA